MGPSIASGSHTWSGNWADLPAAPAKMPSAKTVSTLTLIAPATASSWISAMSRVPVFVQMRMIASSRPTSPSRVTRKAFIAARTAAGLWNQKPISR